MADSDLPGLTALTGAGSATGDLVHVVDVSDTTFAADGTDKRMTLAELALGLITHGAIATDAEVLAGYQPLDSDLTAIAALTTTATGRSLLAAANAAAIRTIADSPSVAEAVLLNPATSGNRITGALTTTDALMFRVSGDTQDRLVVNANGLLEWGSGSVAPSGASLSGAGAGISIINRDAIANVVLTVKGMASQSGSLQEWQDSTATVLASVTNGGRFTAAGATFSGSSPQATISKSDYSYLRFSNGDTKYWDVGSTWSTDTWIVYDGLNAKTMLSIAASTGLITLLDGGHLALGTTTGTKLGTATTQKLGFYNATPVVQGASVADATDAATAITQLNALISRIEALGLIATV